jgi:secretion/DNA translocation related CpaE-like protein
MSATAPLLITSDDVLAEEVLRLAAVAGCCTPQRLTRPADAGDAWRSASTVLLDHDAAVEGADSGLPRRRGVLIIGTASHPDFWRAAFQIGAEQAFSLPDEQDQVVEVLAESVESSAAHSGRVLAVLGGCGGAGASILATATALAAARRGDRTLLLDCDPCGGGLDLAVGTEATAGLRWSGLTITGGRVAATALREALPGRKVGAGELAVLSGDREGESSGMTPEAVRAVIAAGRRAGDTVVCDLPRSLPDAALIGLRHADLTIVLVPAEVRACAAAAQLVTALRPALGQAFAVVRGPSPGGLTVADVGRAVGLGVLTAMRLDPALPGVIDRGGLCSSRAVVRGSLGRTVRDVLEFLDDTDTTLVGAA